MIRSRPERQEASLEFRILGPLEVLDGGRSVALPRGRARALLALLVLSAGDVLSSERLIDELWGDAPPPTAPKALQGLVSKLRKHLEPARPAGAAPGVLRTAPPGYVLAVDPTGVDAIRFRTMLEEAQATPAAAERAPALREALALWRGPALADFTYEPFAQREIAALHELRVTALEERIEADLAVGSGGELVGELEDLVAEHPFRERLRGQLMLALYRAGRQADALEAYRDARRALVDELGIEPGPALRELEAAVLRQDPSLDLERVPVPPEVVSARATVEEPWLPGERRIVTVAFVELAAPLDAGEGLDPEALRRIVSGPLDVAAGVLRRYEATVEEIIGESLVAVFGLPMAHEDDPLRAIRAALEVREAVATLNDQLEPGGTTLQVRVGVETGEVLVGPAGARQPRMSGAAVNVASRLQRLASAGEVLVGAEIQSVLRRAAVLAAVDRGGSDGAGLGLPAWRLVDLVPGAELAPRRLDAPMIGRVAELDRLRAAFGSARGRGAVYRFTVLGEAGIGKSRLARELAEGLASQARILTGRCQAYGEGITFRPLREIALQAAGRGGAKAVADLLRGEEDAERLAAQVATAIGLADPAGGAEDLFPAIRRFLEALAARDPLVVVFEDLHWAEPTFLDLIEYLGTRGRGPMLLLCLARPELLEERPAWGAGGRTADTLVLEPLSPSETEKLIADRLVGGPLPPEALAQIVEIARGNPLFAEQMVAAFDEEGVVSVPASVHALLAARLDRLGPAERDLLRCAAVVGGDVTSDALAALVPEPARPFVRRHLQALERRRLIRPTPSPGQGFSFGHDLIQEASYRSMTREARAGLHERFAEWLEKEAADPTPELDELVGYHLERAVLDRRAAGIDQGRERALALRAGEHLTAGGLRAFDRFDVAAAENLLSRARSLLPPGHPQRPEVMLRLAEVYPVLTRPGAADEVLAALQEELGAAGDPRLGVAVGVERARIQMLIGPDPVRVDAIREQAERALDAFSSWEDHTGIAQASFVLAMVHMRRGATREMEAVARRGLASAQRSENPREEGGARWNVAWAVATGETPVPEAIQICEELARWRGEMHAGVLCELAILRAMTGDFDEARHVIALARRQMAEQMRVRGSPAFVAWSSGRVEILAGDDGAAERELGEAVEKALTMGAREQIALPAAALSRVLSAQGGSEDAEAFADLSLESAPSESVAAQAMWRAAKARVLVSGDADGEAQRLAKGAVDLVPAEMPNLRADVLFDLAEVLRVGGDRQGAMQAIAQAIELYERKGNLASADRARSSTE